MKMAAALVGTGVALMPEDSEAMPKDWKVFKVSVGDKLTTVIKNPTIDDMHDLSVAFRREHPYLGKGVPYARTTIDKEGNKYVWPAFGPLHNEMEPKLNSMFNTVTDQNAHFGISKYLVGTAAGASAAGLMAPSDSEAMYVGAKPTEIGAFSSLMDRMVRKEIVKGIGGQSSQVNMVPQGYGKTLIPASILSAYLYNSKAAEAAPTNENWRKRMASEQALQEPTIDPTTVMSPTRFGGGLMNLGLDSALKLILGGY